MAAGMGSRLENLTEDLPKALVKVHGKELLSYVFDFLNRRKISEIFVVGGYKFEKIEKFLVGLKFEKNIKLLKNDRYDKGNILSLLTALPLVTEDLLLMNVDHIYYNSKIFDKLIGCVNGITAVCDFDRKLGPDDMKVLLNDKKVIKISKKLNKYDGGYVGMTIVAKDKLSIYKNAAEKLASKYSGEIHVENILQFLANEGESINCCDISGLGWVEVDTKEDLKNAERVLKEYIANK